MPISIGCVLFNYENGGLQPSGGYDFGPLRAALAASPRRPDLIFFCEAKRYADNGGNGLLHAAKAISDQFDAPYIGLLGYMERGPMPPAIFYNPAVLTQLPPWYGHGSHHDYHDQRNVARFAVRGTAAGGEPDVEFLAGVDHWEPLSGPVRELAARRWGRYGRKGKLPAILAGDTNATPSGPHFAARDWALAAELDWTNASHKGREQDGTWVADTAAMDHLIGRWVDGHGRVGGAGFSSLAELAWQMSMDCPAAARPGLLGSDGRILPTVNDEVDVGGGLHIDNVIANDLMLRHVDPGTFQIHVPPPGVRYSDHRAVSWELRIGR